MENANMCIWLFYSDYSRACKKGGKTFMTISNISNLRNDSTGLYFEFIEYFLSSVVGKNQYKMCRCEKKISEFATVSDEALAILIFENNLDTWKDMSEKNITKNSSVAKKYTNGGTSKGAVTSSRRYQGWSSNGLKRFNELFDLVKEDRESNCANDFEESFLQFCINGGVNGKVKKREAPLFEAINVRHDLWTQETDIFLLSESPICYDIEADVVCDYQENNITMKGTKKMYDDSDEDEDAFGAKTTKAMVQV